VPAEHEMGACAGKPGGASAWHWDFPVRPAMVQLATSVVLGVLPPLGLSPVLLEQATREPRTKAEARRVRVMPP